MWPRTDFFERSASDISYHHCKKAQPSECHQRVLAMRKATASAYDQLEPKRLNSNGYGYGHPHTVINASSFSHWLCVSLCNYDRQINIKDS
eukprot:5577192-Karenia_brevis.AAC.1